MPSTTNYMNTARDENFAARVAFIVMKSSVNIANEDPATEHHAQRLAFAQKHFRGEINNKALAAAAIASNSTLQSNIDSVPDQKGSNISDSDLEFVINGLINPFSFAYAAAPSA